MTSSLEDAFEYCRSVTVKHAKSFYFAARFLPLEKRRAVFPIYAFCRHVDDEIDEAAIADAEKAATAVERWRVNLGAVYDGVLPEGDDVSPQQKLVFRAWLDVIAKYPIPPSLPIELVEGVLMDTTIKRYETFEDLYLYCFRVASTVGLMSSEILGYHDPKAVEYAEAMGIAMQLTNILRDVREDASMGRIYLPQEDLRRFDVDDDQILAGRFDGNFDALMRFEIDRARHYYREGEKGIAMLSSDSRFTVLLASRIYAKILDEIDERGRNVFLGRAHTTRFQKMASIPSIWLAAKKFR
jgi:phytoene synthase